MRLFPVMVLMMAAALASPAVLAESRPPATVAEAKDAQVELASRLGTEDFRHVNAHHRERIAALQGEIKALPEAGGASDLLRAREIAAEIDEVLADAELDRQVCVREKPTGSNRIMRVCRTKRQIAEQARASRDHGPLRSASGCGMEVCPGG